jgi:hypothetical protein
MNLKFQIAKLIGRQYIVGEHSTYENILEAIYENEYRCILKVPTGDFFLGILETFKTPDDIEVKNKILKITKEVVKEAMEVSGIELTFSDEKWDELEIIPNPEPGPWRPRYIFKEIPKSYLCEYFEI